MHKHSFLGLLLVVLVSISSKSWAGDTCTPQDVDVCAIAKEFSEWLASTAINDPDYKGEFPTVSVTSEGGVVHIVKRSVHSKSEYDNIMSNDEAKKASFVASQEQNIRKLGCFGRTLYLIRKGGAFHMTYEHAGGEPLVDVYVRYCPIFPVASGEAEDPGDSEEPELQFVKFAFAVKALETTAVSVREACTTLEPAQADMLLAAHRAWVATHAGVFDDLSRSYEKALDMIAAHDKLDRSEVADRNEERFAKSSSEMLNSLKAQSAAEVTVQCGHFAEYLEAQSPVTNSHIAQDVARMRKLAKALFGSAFLTPSD